MTTVPDKIVYGDLVIYPLRDFLVHVEGVGVKCTESESEYKTLTIVDDRQVKLVQSDSDWWLRPINI